jgi:hypothetical protein
MDREIEVGLVVKRGDFWRRKNAWRLEQSKICIALTFSSPPSRRFTTLLTFNSPSTHPDLTLAG